MITNQTEEALEWILHKRVLPFKNYMQELQAQNINPYWEYHKQPIIAREIRCGIAKIKAMKVVPDEVNIYENIIYGPESSTIQFYVKFL